MVAGAVLFILHHMEAGAEKAGARRDEPSTRTIKHFDMSRVCFVRQSVFSTLKEKMDDPRRGKLDPSDGSQGGKHMFGCPNV